MEFIKEMLVKRRDEVVADIVIDRVLRVVQKHFNLSARDMIGILEVEKMLLVEESLEGVNYGREDEGKD